MKLITVYYGPMVHMQFSLKPQRGAAVSLPAAMDALNVFFIIDPTQVEPIPVLFHLLSEMES